jgi:hypothetical protein
MGMPTLAVRLPLLNLEALNQGIGEPAPKSTADGAGLLREAPDLLFEGFEASE